MSQQARQSTHPAKVRLAFVGVGAMGQCAHLRNYAIHPGCHVVALAELRPELARAVAARYGVSRVYPDHRQLLAAEAGRIDGVVAVQPYHQHACLLPEILSHGLPVMIEKPLARSSETARTVLAAVKDGGRLFVGYHKRSDPATVYARRQIQSFKESGEFGAFRYLRVTMPPGSWDVSGFSTLIQTDEPAPALDPDPAPAGMDAPTAKKLDVFVNYYIHQVNLIRHLIGEPYDVSYADPTGVLLVGHGVTSGAAVTLEMQPYRTTLDWQEVALACFERGWVKLELPAPLAIDRPGRVTVFKDPGGGAEPVTVTPQLPWVHAMRQQADFFLHAIRGEPTPLCEADEAADDLRLAERYIALLDPGGSA